MHNLVLIGVKAPDKARAEAPPCMTDRDPPLELEEDDDFMMALPWLPEREPSMLLPEGAAPNDNFDALLNQWLMSAMQQGAPDPACHDHWISLQTHSSFPQHVRLPF